MEKTEKEQELDTLYDELHNDLYGVNKAITAIRRRKYDVGDYRRSADRLIELKSLRSYLENLLVSPRQSITNKDWYLGAPDGVAHLHSVVSSTGEVIVAQVPGRQVARYVQALPMLVFLLEELADEHLDSRISWLARSILASLVADTTFDPDVTKEIGLKRS